MNNCPSAKTAKTPVSSLLIDVALATYNGQRYLAAQLDDVLNQTVVPKRVVIGDDGSTDGTLEIVREYQARGHYIKLVTRSSSASASGASANFCHILTHCDASYVFCCDQDDRWDPDKIETSMLLIRQLEKMHGADTPLLVHSDMRLIDGQGQRIADSLFAFQNLDKHGTALRRLLCQSVVTGCSVLVNRALLDKALPIHPDAVMHDWWLSLVASAFGQIGFVDRPTLSYRQHTSNSVGAKRWGAGLLARRAIALLRRRGAAELLEPSLRQASAFAQTYGHALDPEARRMVMAVGSLARQSGVRRILTAARYRLKKHGVARTLGFYWALLIARF